MSDSQTPITLAVSKRMGTLARKSGEEHSTIRLPLKTRERFGVDSNHLEIASASGKTVTLKVKQALLQDIGEYTGDTRAVGFVTAKTYKSLVSPESSNVWISKHTDNLVVGSDPEFGLIVPSNGYFEYASKVYSDGTNSPIGHDGPCMELRPDPSSDIEVHVKNIKKLIEKGASKKPLEQYKWYTGATYKHQDQDRKYTIGGHIHVGNPESVNRAITDGILPQKDNIHRRIIRVLDELVGVPLTRIDSPDAAFRRRQGYGNFGDFRAQSNRFEWRTPSAMWLTHPDLARAVIGTVKAVSEACYAILESRLSNNHENTAWLGAAGGTKKSFLHDMGCVPDERVRDFLSNSTKTYVPMDVCKSIATRLKNLITYHKYRSYIDRFIELTSLPVAESDSIDLFGMKENWLAGKSLFK